MSRSRGVVLNCFSSPVMLVTFVVEIALALYTIWRFKLDQLGKLVVVTLAALAFFQLSEYHVCTGGLGLDARTWSRAGFVAITLLPPLGLHIVHVLAGKPGRKLVALAYGSMLAFVVYFLFVGQAIQGYACTGNYVIFQIGRDQAGVYAAYYYSWLLVGITLGMHWANRLQVASTTATRKRVESLRGMVIGYLVFLVPTALANSVNPETRRGIPSIMCGFAVLFALILTFYILPRLAMQRQKLDDKP
jgi:hypothetical protein